MGKKEVELAKNALDYLLDASLLSVNDWTEDDIDTLKYLQNFKFDIITEDDSLCVIKLVSDTITGDAYEKNVGYIIGETKAEEYCSRMNDKLKAANEDDMGIKHYCFDILDILDADKEEF